MSYSKKRIDYNNNWPNKEIEFQGQNDFEKLLLDKGLIQIFKPIKLPLITDFQFQRLLSFKIDIYEQLPYRPDIAFDLAWRTFEAYSTHYSVIGNWSVTKAWKILNKVSEDVLINALNNNLCLKLSFENLTKLIPLQATEFLIKRLFESTSNAIKSQQKQIIERTKECIGDDLYDALENKYGKTKFNAENQRKAGMLLQLIISGKEVNINSNKYKLSLLEILKFIISGILYSYRNERFHGDSFSPFKSSKTQIKTYALSYYYLIATYFLISLLIFKEYEPQFNVVELCDNLNSNNSRFKLAFENQLKK
jgi:hypothetical protein